MRRFATPAQFDAGVVLPANAGTGKVLTSDASGNGGWASITASIPGGGNIYSGMGPPPENVGALGDFWLDTTGGLLYGPKGTQVSSPLNLHPNPSVEDPLGFSTYSAPSSGYTIRERTPEWAAHGIYGYHVKWPPVAAANRVVSSGITSGVVNRVPVDASKKYSFAVTVRTRLGTSSNPQFQHRIYCYWADSAGTALTATAASYVDANPGEQTQLRWLNVTPPATAAWCTPSIYAALVTEWDVDVDGWIVVEGATVPTEWPATGTPINLQGPAGGDLSGNYPAPVVFKSADDFAVGGNLRIGGAPFLRRYSSGFAGSFDLTVGLVLGEFTFLAASQNLHISGEVRSNNSQSVGAVQFWAGCRSTTLPSKAFNLFQRQLTPANALQIRLFEDATTGRVVVCLFGTGTVTNVSWSLEVGERANYDYWQNNQVAVTPVLTGLTEFVGDTLTSLYFGAPADVQLYRSIANQLALASGDLLDLGGAGGTAVSAGSTLGDKLLMYSDSYGFGVQTARLVAWVTSTVAGLGIRVASPTGQKSSGTDVITLWGSGKIDSVRAGKDTLNLTDTTGQTGITLGGDTNLYRFGGNVLATDDIFRIYRAALGDNALEVRLTGDASHRFIMEASGKMYWGDGAGVDTNLYRDSPNKLKTDDALDVALALTQAGVAVVLTNDARLTDARAPTTHASTHKLAGADAIRLDELAKPTALVDLNNQSIDNLAGLKIPPGAGAGKLLVSDASGNGTWGDAATPANVASSAAANNNVSTASAATWALIPGSAITIPETGRYFISTGPVTSQKPNNTNAVDARIVIFRNGAAFSREAVATYADAFAAMPLSITGYYDLVAGDVLDLRYSTNNQVNSFGASSLSAYRQLAQGPTGPKGDPGSTEYAFISGGGGTATPMAGAGSWIALPVGQATPRTNVPAGAFTLNANGSVTVRDGGVYKVEASTLGSAVWTTNAVRAAVGVGVGATAVAAGANLFARNDATTVGTADSPSSNVSGTMELAAGDTVWIVGFTATSAGSLQVSYFSLSRVGAGPQGPQGAQGPAGTLGVSTVYPMGALPAAGSTGQIVLFEANVAAGTGGQAAYNDVWMAVWRADIGVWQVLGYGFPLTATTDPTDLAAGTGWRKPTGTPSVECPYAGSYEVDAYCEANYSALTGCAVGPAISTLAATGTPPASGGASAYLTNVTVVTRTPPGARINTTNPKTTAADVTYDLRVWNAVSSTILFVRATLNVRPVYVYGVA